MGYISGMLKEITWHHPVLGSGTLSPKSNEDSTIDTGGIRSADEKNSIAGDGTAIRKMEIERWSVDTMIANDDNIGLQLEAIVALASDPNEAIFKITHISGAVYQGSGFPVGDVAASFGNATIKLKLSGSNQLVKIL